MMRIHRVCVYAVIALCMNWECLGLPAFPGAEGYGTETPGGRGGSILFVENLNDQGPGSLRAALTAKGKRIVLFRTGGLITLSSGIIVAEPYLTVAGQTAPGDGICLKAAPGVTDALITVKTHDVIIRGLRLRPGGDGSPPTGDNRDCLALGTQGGYKPAEGTGNAHDIVVDHCSLSWAVDENMQIYYKNSRITVQHCILSEGLHFGIHSKSQNPPPKGQPYPYSHSMGLLVGGGGSRNVSIHHNLFAHNYHRNPRIDGGSHVEVVNNVVYDWGGRAVDLVGDGNGPMCVNVIGNYFKPGPKTDKDSRRGVWINAGGSAPEAGTKLYVRGNTDGARTSPTQDEWDVAAGWKDAAAMRTTYRTDEPAVPLSGITMDADAALAYERVLADAGAVPRDAVDQRIVRDVREGTGRLINSVADAGGWPTYAAGAAPTDTDNDGMPDEWEKQRGLDPAADDAASAKLSNEGYTNIEVYVNGLLER